MQLDLRCDVLDEFMYSMLVTHIHVIDKFNLNKQSHAVSVNSTE